MRADAGQVDAGLDAGITTTDDSDALAFVEGAVAVRTKGHAAAHVVFLAWDAKLAPLGPGGQDQRIGVQDFATLQA